MKKPNWDRAPSRANYLAQDLGGSWYWFELEPYDYTGKLWATHGASWYAGGKGDCIEPHWKSTLEPRPC